jgi:hypothetical protein
MMSLASTRLRPCALLLACALSALASAGASGTGVASATVLPSTLSPSIALYVRTAPRPACFGNCAGAPAPAGAWPPAARLVGLSPDGVAQFSMSGATASTYVVQFDAAAYGAWWDRGSAPITLEPRLTADGRLSVLIASATALAGAPGDAFRVVVNYN